MSFRAWLVVLSVVVPAAAIAGPRTASPPADPWAAMIERVSPAVVSIEVASTRSFDNGRAGHSFATGFVVDAERGILLSNRHVVEPGPVKSEMILQDNEVVPLRAIYRDPIHDFGFYQYDPVAVRTKKLPALTLDPSAIKIGAEIRVLGNNAGEKLSIHSGTIARLDREAPRYGREGFNDFNTFYIQAAAGTTGGSSGSPVLDISGRVVALNAGARRDSSASFYLPLDRVVRALKLIQEGQTVSRGSIHTVFGYTAFDELDRLGLADATEAAARARNPDGTGLLVVREVLPGGPAEGKLEVGDVLLAAEGTPVDSFMPLDVLIDDHVGGNLDIAVERGGKPIDIEVSVMDLHAATPSEYVEFAGDILHALSYQQARNNNIPVQGVYLADAGYAFRHGGVSDGARIDAINGQATPTVDALWEVLSGLADGARVEVRWVRLDEPRRTQVAAIVVDRHLFPMRRCKRDDQAGSWPCVEGPQVGQAPPPVPSRVPLATAPSGPPQKVANALVYVEARLPFVLAGNGGDFYTGVGVIVDARAGLVLVDRDTVPQSLAEVSVIVGGSLRVQAQPIYFHPDHNLAILQYDPKLLAGTGVVSAKLDTRRPPTGTDVWQVGLNGRQELTWSATQVEGYQPFVLTSPAVPQYRESNIDLLTTVDPPLEKGGVIVDRSGAVRAFLGSFVDGSGKGQSAKFSGLPADVIADVVSAMSTGQPPPDRTLGIAFRPLPLSAARDRGLPSSEADKLSTDGQSRRILVVTHVEPGTDAAGKVQPGDLLLSIDGRATSSWRTVEGAAANASVSLGIWRQGAVHTVQVQTQQVRTDDITEAIVWAGALIHAPHRPLLMQQGVEPTGLYVAWRWFGSPADRYGLDPTWRIVGVDDSPVTTLAEFVAAVRGRPDNAPVRLFVLDLDGRKKVVPLRLDTVYWPASTLSRTENGWTRNEW